ncbi:MAG: 6-phosphogluconolactonase [Chloroflexota bacterium]|jgi:6-phosphogluconolactonase
MPDIIRSDNLAAAALPFVVASLESAVQSRGLATFVLSGGSTPQALYRRLAAEPNLLDWRRVHLFWGDERLVPPDDEESNYGQAHATLIEHVPVPAAHVRRIKGELAAAEAAGHYACVLRDFRATHDPGAPHSWPRFDLVLLGLGEDGHTASLFPGSSPAVEPVIAVTGDYGGRPANRVSLTPLVLNDARQIFFLAGGAGKAEAVACTIEGPPDPEQLPAQRIRPRNGEVRWFLDHAAAASLTH